jgi:hypothetical protein
MACDGGCIRIGEKVIAVAGTGSGADTALVATAAPTSRLGSSASMKSFRRSCDIDQKLSCFFISLQFRMAFLSISSWCLYIPNPQHMTWVAV